MHTYTLQIKDSHQTEDHLIIIPCDYTRRSLHFQGQTVQRSAKRSSEGQNVLGRFGDFVHKALGLNGIQLHIDTVVSHTTHSDAHLKFLALTIPEKLRGFQNSKNRSRDPVTGEQCQFLVQNFAQKAHPCAKRRNCKNGCRCLACRLTEKQNQLSHFMRIFTYLGSKKGLSYREKILHRL